MPTKKEMSRERAIEELETLKRDLFPFLHKGYNIALDMAMEALKRSRKPK